MYTISTGGDCIKSFKVLSDKRHILTSDNDHNVTMWDVFTVEQPVTMALQIL